MKSTGIVRKLDELGRVVLPIELRRTMDLNIHDTVEIFVEDDKIILKSITPPASSAGRARRNHLQGQAGVCQLPA